MCVYTYIHTDYCDWPFVVSHCSSRNVLSSFA